MREHQDQYSRLGAGVQDQVEMEVIGFPGAVGYTTFEQADMLADALDLRPGVRVLDVGSGAGWPSLYLVVRTGCHAFLTDVPEAAIRNAERRSKDGPQSVRCSFAVASGTHLPLKPGSFDAILHTDMLC